MFQLEYIFGNIKHNFDQYMFFEAAYTFSTGIYFSNRVPDFFSINVFLSDRFISVSIHVFELKDVFFLLECMFFNQGSYFQLAEINSKKCQIHFVMIINIFWKDYKYFQCVTDIFNHHIYLN